MGGLLWRKVWVSDRVVRVGITERPAVHCDRKDIFSGMKARRTEHAIQLLADLNFEIAKSHGQKFLLPGAVLFLSRQAGLVRVAHHVEKDRLLWHGRTAITSQRSSRVQGTLGVIHTRRVDDGNADVAKRRPPAQQDVGVHHRHFYWICEGIPLPLRKVRYQRRNEAVIASQDAVSRADDVRFAVLNIGNAHGPGIFWRTLVLHADRATPQPDA